MCSNDGDQAHRWECPMCNHEIFGVSDFDECVNLIDDHLSIEHEADIHQYVDTNTEQ